MENLELIRIVSFISITFFVLILEFYKPSFPNQKYNDHLKVNLLLFGASTLVLKIAFPFGLYQLAIKINESGQSLFKIAEQTPFLSLFLTILLFDLAIYWQHRLFHIIPLLWRAHRVHHTDQSMDLTTGFRFHPIEIILSGIYKIIIMMIVGPLAEYYLLYEVLLSGFALLTHANVKIPASIDMVIRKIFVTPAMHYPHHSPDIRLTNSNYGNILSIWDKLFRSYTTESNNQFGLNNVSRAEANSILEQFKTGFKK